jgi:hypothetical protein
VAGRRSSEKQSSDAAGLANCDMTSLANDNLRQQPLGFSQQLLLLMALISNISNGVESGRYVQTNE